MVTLNGKPLVYCDNCDAIIETPGFCNGECEYLYNLATFCCEDCDGKPYPMRSDYGK